MVLSGSVVLAHQDVRVARLSELEQDSFDGAYRTKSFGRITDYNLMVAKGNRGTLDAVELTQDSRKLDFDEDWKYERKTAALFCRDGFCGGERGRRDHHDESGPAAGHKRRRRRSL